MLKTTKIWGLILAIVIVLSLTLTSCVAPSQTGSGTEKPSDSTPAASTPSEPTVTLKMYLVGNRQEPDTPMVLEEANKYLKDKLNVALDLNVFAWGDDYDQKVNTALASGEAIDIVFTANWAANYYVNAASGYFTELNSYLEKYPAIKQILGEDFLNGSALNGKNYAVPTNKEKVHNWGYLVRKDLVDKYNMDLSGIDSYEKIEPLLKIIKDNEPEITPCVLPLWMRRSSCLTGIV